jgi:hypothetical protein
MGERDTPMRPPPPRPARERVATRSPDIRSETDPPTERDLLITMSEQLGEIYQGWPDIKGMVLRHDDDLRAHGRRLDDHGARLNKLEAPPARPPLPSFSDLDEEITLNGTRHLRVTPAQLDQLISTRIATHETQAALVRDAAPKRYVVGKLIPMAWGAAITAAVGLLITKLASLFHPNR